MNPRSGGRRALRVLKDVETFFAAAGATLDIRVTERAGHARQIAEECDPKQCDGLCLIGGDGTIHEAVGGLLARGQPATMPLGIIPCGTGNDVARQLGLKGPADAARRITAGSTCTFDVARVISGGQVDYCVTLVGWTGVADINCRAERMRLLGPPRYAISAFWQIAVCRRRRATLVLDDRSIEDDFLLVAACNTVFCGSGMRLTPRAKVDDGKIDVVVIRRASRWEMIHLFAKVFHGTHVNMPNVEYFQVRSLSILADDPHPLDIDGEIKGTTPVSIEMLPGALRLFV